MPPRKRSTAPSATSAASRKRAGARAAGFFKDCLHHTKGQWAGQSFKVLPWQRDMLERTFGTLQPDGLRQYRRVYIEVPRKNGKSSLAAGIALYLLLGEDEPGAEIYSAAADREQAAIVFAQAREMLQATPDLLAHVKIYQRSIVREKTGASYRVLSADVPTKHGLNAHGIIFDELHAQTNRQLWDVLTMSTGARRQPLTVALTTAGYDRQSICWEQHDYAVKVRDGVIADPTFLPVIYSAEQEHDWTQRETWAHANPSLGHTITEEYLAQECVRAQRSPAYENSFRRYHLNQWTEQSTRWMPMEAWRACDGLEIDDHELDGVPCFAGLDLAQQEDFTAFVVVFLLRDGRVALRTRFWLPEIARETHPMRPYAVWQRQGHLVLTDGDATDLDLVERDVLDWCRRYGIREVAYDKKFAAQLALHLQGAGVAMIDQPQGFGLNEALRKLLELVHAKRLIHGADPVLTWMASNMVVRQGLYGEIRADKDKASEKVDGIVALAMALDRAIRHNPEGDISAYADHGLLTV